MTPLPATGPARILVAVAADGAGSAPRAAEGARLACRAFLDLAGAALADPAPGCAADAIPLGDDFASHALAGIRRALDARAADGDGTVRDLACTLLAAVVGENAALFLQVGDGAIAFRTDHDPAWRLALPPTRGEHSNETVFVTHDEAAHHLGVRRVAARVSEFALMTDGVEFLAVHRARGEPHAPFLDHALAGLRIAPPGPAPAHADWLGGFLASDAVCRRTDDDKTLLLASRFAPADPPP